MPAESFIDVPAARRMAREVEQCLGRALPRTLTRAWLARHAVAPHAAGEAALHTAMLSQPVWELLARPGKRWRPLFGLCLLEALGVARAPYLLLFCSLAELCHTATLIVDDIEDGAAVRRGGPCVHLRHGVDVALNAANTLYFLPLQQVTRDPALTQAQRLKLLRIVSDCYVRGHFGQAADIYRSRHLSAAHLARWLRAGLPARILDSYALKTASGIEALADAACALARSPAAVRTACTAFARAFGVAFQIMDDVQNFTQPPRAARAADDDIAAGKLTYVSVRALMALPPGQRRQLERIICTPRLRAGSVPRRAAHALVRSSGALERCRDEAWRMMEDAWAALAPRLPRPAPRALLHTLCASLLTLRDTRVSCRASARPVR